MACLFSGSVSLNPNPGPRGTSARVKSESDLQMNDRWDDSPQTGIWPVTDQSATPGPADVFVRPIMKRRATARGAARHTESLHLPQAKEHVMARDSLAVISRDHACHVIAEDYSYKSEAYYTILARELAGDDIRPSSRAVLDAFVVPVCLERAKNAGIPVVGWGISQAYVPLPAILYGLNYFATASDYFVVQNNTQAKEVIRHITNKGKLPLLLPETRRHCNDYYLHCSLWADYGELCGDSRLRGEDLRDLLYSAREHGLCPDRGRVRTLLTYAHALHPPFRRGTGFPLRVS